MVISVFAAYALSRYRLVRTVSFVGRLMFIAQMTPPVLLVIPIYIIMGKLGLLNTYAALIITYTSFSVPVSSWILKSYFDNLPIDMEESALLDGCSRTGALLRIVLPVSLPSLVATAVYTFVLAWSDFLFGFTLISTNNMRPATSELGLLEGLWTVQWGQLMAGSVLCIIPVVIVFVVFQRYFVNGLLLGATKG
ncbi:MAG: carbohydrate ABC transporter permease [Alicyclobacillus sp.]|nr:carbohydrate ABC transporter permease [Alicyclobacillus sp.]